MSLGNALGYLTVLPVPPKRQIPLARSLHYFPLVGMAVGSLSLLVFIWAGGFLPVWVDCVFAVLFAQSLAGWIPIRGLAEAVQGRRTHPGYGFHHGFRPNARGLAAASASLLIKAIALILLPAEWKPRAVFVFPILGYCARTWAFLLSRPHGPRMARLPLPRRRIYAGFLSGALLFLLFLFPLRAALPALAALALLVVWGRRRRNRKSRGLTLQTASFLSEAAEVSVLAVCAIAAFLPGP